MTEDKNENTRPTVLLLAVTDRVTQIIKGACDKCELKLINSEEEFEEQFDEFNDSDFAVIICSTELGDNFPLEAAQILRNQCPRTPSIFVTFQKENYQPGVLKKNGFSETYLLPIDSQSLIDSVVECLHPDALAAKNFRSVKIMDLKPNTTLNFDTYVFLPLNKKYVRLSAKNQSLSEKKFNKLQAQNQNSLYLEQKDMAQFYDYTAEQLKDLAQGTGPMGATEREEKLKESVRGLFHSIFDQSEKADFNTGKEMLNTCQNIVSTYITGDAKTNWYNQILATIGGATGGYDHAANVSTFAAMFALGLGHEAPEDLAMAGFLHDISLSDFPEELLDLPESEWPEDKLEYYKNHPQTSINIIKKKKMIITENVEKAILQHHEMFSGKGFPKGLPGAKIHEDAQILSFADQFSDLTSQVEGKKTYGPVEACEEIEKNGSINPALTRRIKKLLLKP